ncbi:hypothetical protein V2J09_016225 [Rumex salicifolius]
MVGSYSAMAKGGRQSRRKSPTSTLQIAVALMLLSFVFVLGFVSLPTPTSISSGKSDSGHHISSKIHSSVQRGGDKWIEFVSWEPRAFVYHNFLSKEECKYLIDVATPHMQKARTSSGAFLTRGQDKIISNIEKRIADWTFIPADHGEGLHVLHYKVGQKYDAHFDYFADNYNTKIGGQRMATVLIYLSDVEEGGETVFPNAKGNHSAVPYWDELSQCAKGGLSVKPKMGDALLFWSMKPDATLDPLSLHANVGSIDALLTATTDEESTSVVFTHRI